MLRKARLAAIGADGERLLRVMGELDPQAQGEWLKLLTDEQLIAVTRTHASRVGIDLSRLLTEDLNRIVAGDLDPLRQFYSDEEWREMTING
jgi:hypothetical protein